jgi:hypothetical protein
MSTLGRLRQEDCEFKDNLSYIRRPCLTKGKRKQKERKVLDSD